jgi:glyoxylase I family protein
MSDADLRAMLLRFEAALAARDPDGIEGGLMSLIADDFVEFGRSGRVWTRDSIREPLEGPPAAPVPIDRFEVAELGDRVALVTYRGAMANRSSIWVRRDGRWQMRFHQGTPTAG